MSWGWPVTRGNLPDLVLAGTLAVGTFLVHDVRYIFTAPFWTDEAWVAISTKLPLHEIFRVTSSTPVGWTLLLRLAFLGGDQRLRIIPLLFAALTVTAAFGYARSLPWPSVFLGRLAGVLAGSAALVVPSALVRNDLKQYTADAFLTLLILLLASRLERCWTRRRLITLGGVVVFGFLFSAVSVFVGAAAFGSILLVLLHRRHSRAARATATVGGAAGVVLGVIFVVLYRPGITPGLNSYWAPYYLPISDGWDATQRFVSTKGGREFKYLGMGPAVIAALLVAAGTITIIGMRRPAVALVVPTLLAEMIVAAAVRQYPMFDPRTSHFLTTAIAVTAAIGVAGLCALLARIHVAAAAAAAVLVLALFVGNVHDNIRRRSLPAEDLRTPTAYLAAHQQPGDIIVVNGSSSWGFAYYWEKGTPALKPTTTNLQRFQTVFPDQPNILVAESAAVPAVDAVMNKAIAAAARTGPKARIWIIYQHLHPGELPEYTGAARTHHLTSQQIIANSLILLTPAKA